LTQAQTVAAGNAIRQLDRVRVAVSVKAPRNEYDLVLDTSSRAVAELLPNIPDGPLKQEITAALAAYKDAGKAWAQPESAETANARSSAWQQAEERLNKAKELLTKENRIF
jgi:acyl-CoA reductase-like NAD-dependent aldehyde dehydrogenase